MASADNSHSAHPGKLARQALYWRRHGRPDVAERIELDLAQLGRCRVCGRTLSDPASVARGVGPNCHRLRVLPEEPGR